MAGTRFALPGLVLLVCLSFSIAASPSFSDAERSLHGNAVEAERAAHRKELAEAHARLATVFGRHGKALSDAVSRSGLDRKSLESQILDVSKAMQQAATPEAQLGILRAFGDRNRPGIERTVAAVVGADAMRREMLDALAGGQARAKEVRPLDPAATVVGVAYERLRPPTRTAEGGPKPDPEKEKKAAVSDVEEYDVSPPFHEVDAHNSSRGLRETRRDLEAGNMLVTMTQVFVGASNSGLDQDASIEVPITLTRPAVEVQVTPVFRDPDAFSFEWTIVGILPGVFLAHVTGGVQLWDDSRRLGDRHVDGVVGEWWLAASVGEWTQRRTLAVGPRPMVATGPWAGATFPVTLRARVFIIEGQATAAGGASFLRGTCRLERVHVRIVH